MPWGGGQKVPGAAGGGGGGWAQWHREDGGQSELCGERAPGNSQNREEDFAWMELEDSVPTLGTCPNFTPLNPDLHCFLFLGPSGHSEYPQISPSSSSWSQNFPVGGIIIRSKGMLP